MFSHSSETVDWPWMLRYQSGDWVFKNSTADGVREPARITGQNTTQQFGRGANQPYKFAVPEIIIGARHHTSATAAPTSGSWAQGDIVWNQNATSGGFAGWICVTAGTFGGSAPVFRTFGAISSS